MQIALNIITIITLCGMVFTWGFFIGKGKVEVKRKISDADRKRMEKMEREQEEAIAKYNKAVEEIMTFNALDD